MREAGRRLAEVLAGLREQVQVGMTPLDLDRLAENQIRAMGAVPSFKGYRVGRATYHHTLCISVNDAIIHGVPDDRPFLEGDIVSVDAGLVYGGYHADSAFSLALGPASDEVGHLLDAAEASLYRGIAQARAGLRIGDIGHAIQSHLQPRGFGVVRDYVGHGIGRRLHERPSVPNYGKPRRGQLLRHGMCLAIEPMVTMGSRLTRVLEDAWTVVTRDGSWAAHFEHTVAITPEGPEILTALPGELSAGVATSSPPDS